MSYLGCKDQDCASEAQRAIKILSQKSMQKSVCMLRAAGHGALHGTDRHCNGLTGSTDRQVSVRQTLAGQDEGADRFSIGFCMCLQVMHRLFNCVVSMQLVFYRCAAYV